MNLKAILIAGLVAVSCGYVRGVSQAGGLPNMVLIIADDVSQDLSCYGGDANTPNIDGLANIGVRFENAYVTASSCSPSRCSIITGRYPHNTGAPELLMGRPEGRFLFPETFERLYKGARPPTGILPGQTAGAVNINDPGPR